MPQDIPVGSIIDSLKLIAQCVLVNGELLLSNAIVLYRKLRAVAVVCFGLPWHEGAAGFELLE
jgi:hypothetical protein